MKNKTWFITGVSTGFGREWSLAALNRGDKVIGTVRRLSDAAHLVDQFPDTFFPLLLDVKNRQDCFKSVQQAYEHFSKIDIFINNAGYGQFGFLEELSENEIREQIETNVFGSIWMLQAITPYFREQGFGHIIQLSSIGGLLSLPGVSLYHASKYAVEGICDSLSQELADFGVSVTLIEPASFETDFATRSAKTALPMSIYDSVREKRRKNAKPSVVGSAKATSEILLKIVDSENPPLRLLMGLNCFERVENEYLNRIKVWREWLEESKSAHGEI